MRQTRRLRPSQLLYHFTKAICMLEPSANLCAAAADTTAKLRPFVWVLLCCTVMASAAAPLNLLPGSKSDQKLELLHIEGDFVTCTQ